ncbi:phage tail sheath family protein [Hymenobacter sp. GOD-10R]|uniref:phage tail sheath family protein n=1 Tax=Hymenobacter sp. GOD-10R TaxID=3093922 RepID=UPI002D7673CA|nr:phage tail sheath C-terminal domain-containing protein [Hymenobacter sp. GOD-10R]WRQ30096.1 phage tail sheath C-terminal domain-containing protein [Hymenobacter sp. GOD-10R]
MASTLNLASVRTPGVYIDEVSLFPPSVAQVETAIPVFIGPTQDHVKDGQSIRNVPTRIKSMVEYRRYFGGGPDRQVTVRLDALNSVSSVNFATSFYLHDSLMMFFGNGGEKCYIVSLGKYTDVLTQTDYTNALDTLKKFDEPTLIVLPDALNLTAAGAVATVQQAAIDHCRYMQDRFAVLDVKVADPTKIDRDDTDIDNFRNGVSSHLNYAAAYYPYLRTTLPLTISFANLTIKTGPDPGTTKTLDELLDPGPAKDLATAAKNIVTDLGAVTGLLPDITDYQAAASKDDKKTYLLGLLTAFTGAAAFTDPTNQTDFNNYIKESAPATSDGLKLTALRDATNALQTSGGSESPQPLFDKTFEQISTYISGFLTKVQARLQAKEVEMKSTIPLYSAMTAAAEAMGIVLPPSGAVVGAYARTDNDRGVWKAPANVGLNYVLGPTAMLTDSEQEDLNVDTNAGKSINAIRAFTGKGTLIWGARTLAGSDNEWRYVSVRRFFIMVEESVKKASAQFVFEPNDANTWVKIRAMIENFLTLQWRAGALAGMKAEHAFFVRVGLGQTMTAQDILNGFMIVEIGMAVVRPAEFIILRFSHKMQES